MSLTAITGGIGSGKSTVSQLLRTMGFDVYDCDARAKHLMTADADLRRDLVEAFGPATYDADGALCRKHLSSIVFANAQRLAELNALVHPAVMRDLEAWHAAHLAAAPGRRLFYESAILFESGFDRLATGGIWCVSAPMELRARRTAARDHASAEAVAARIAAQMPQEERERRSTHIIYNDASHSVIEQVNGLLM